MKKLKDIVDGQNNKLHQYVKGEDNRIWRVSGPDWSGYFCIPEDGGTMCILPYNSMEFVRCQKNGEPL